MKNNTYFRNYKQKSLVFAMAVLLGFISLSSMAQSNKNIGNNTNSSPLVLGYYPANYQQASLTASLTVQNQFMGMGNTLCVWLKGDFTLRQAQGDKTQTQGGEASLRGTKQSQSESISTDRNQSPIIDQTTPFTTIAPQFTATVTNDSTFTKNITTIYIQYYPVQKATALYIAMPEDGILYNAYQVHIKYDNKTIATIKKLYLVPNYTLPELVSSTNEIKINNANKLIGGQAPFQYYWMEYSQGGAKMVSNGRVDELSKLPTITTEDKDATYSLTIKDANYLVSNQYISTKASKNASKNTLGMQVSLYPNPTTSELYVQFNQLVSTTINDRQKPEASSKMLVYSITDLQGKELLKGTLNTADLKTIAVQSLAQGTYMLNISNGKNQENVYHNKFVKL